MPLAHCNKFALAFFKSSQHNLASRCDQSCHFCPLQVSLPMLSTISERRCAISISWYHSMKILGILGTFMSHYSPDIDFSTIKKINIKLCGRMDYARNLGKVEQIWEPRILDTHCWDVRWLSAPNQILSLEHMYHAPHAGSHSPKHGT